MPRTPPAGFRVHRVRTAELTRAEIEAIRDLLWAAFASKHPGAGMTEADWEHALGGIHFLGELEGHIVAHGSVVERELHVAGRPYRTGYVEAVATAPAWQRRGCGTALMEDVDGYIAERFELGALGTGRHGFYERLGWRTWRGPSGVRTQDGVVATAEEDGYVMVLPVAPESNLDLSQPITCDWRPGDVW